MKQEYISVTDSNGRASSLSIHSKSNPGKLKIIGVLPHQTAIEPATIKEAQALIDWLQWWIEENK